MQISQKPPQRHGDGAREPAVLTCSQAMLMVLVLGAHLRTTSFKGWEVGIGWAVWSITLVIHTVAL